MTALVSSAITPLADAALRGLIAALVVAGGIAVLRVRNVVAQKTAWTVVLAGALLMPLIAPWLGPWLARQSWLPAWLPTEPAIAAQLHTRASAAYARAESWLASFRARREAPVTAQAAAPVAVLATDLDTVPVPKSAPAKTSRPKPAPAVYPAENIDQNAVENITESDGAPAALSGQLGPQFPVPLDQSRAAARTSIADTALAIYLVVSFALLLRLLYGLSAAMRLWQAGEPVALAATRIPVRIHPDIASPVTIGSGILLPADCTEWDEAKLRIVLAHEGSHILQRDFYLQLAAGLYTAVFWFSPLGWWLKHRLSDLSETISDRAALNHAASRTSYAQILLEFASRPRTTQLETRFGVAMARKARIANRIEWLLNETRFRQAFSGGRMRILTAALLAPVAVFAATALVRVEARAQQTNPAQQAVPAQAPASAPQSTQAPETGISHPDIAPIQIAPAPAAPAAVPDSVPAPAPAPTPAPTPAPAPLAVTVSPDVKVNTSVSVSTDSTSYGRGYAYAYNSSQSSGDSYAVITKDGQHVRFNGDYHTGTLDKARAQAHGDFLWFTRDGKEYIVDDPAVLARIHALYQPMEVLREQMRAMGKQQREQADRYRAEADRLKAESGFSQAQFDKEMADFRAREPQFKKEMAELSSEMAKMQVPKITAIDQKQLDEIKRQMAGLQATQPDFDKKLNELINKMVSLEVPKINDIDQKKLAELSEKMSEVSSKFGDDQARIFSNNAAYKIDAEVYSKMAKQMATVGAEQGKLGGEMGRMAGEADRQIKSIIDESLKNGKAKPVQ